VEKLSFETIVDMPTPEGGRWIVVAPPAAGWLPATAGAGLTGIALCVPPEGSAENQRIGQNTGFSFLTEEERELAPGDAVLLYNDEGRSLAKSVCWKPPGNIVSYPCRICWQQLQIKLEDSALMNRPTTSQ
jgi:hypothetical protein